MPLSRSALTCVVGAPWRILASVIRNRAQNRAAFPQSPRRASANQGVTETAARDAFTRARNSRSRGLLPFVLHAGVVVKAARNLERAAPPRQGHEHIRYLLRHGKGENQVVFPVGDREAGIVRRFAPLRGGMVCSGACC